jgi:hypothetical protein
MAFLVEVFGPRIHEVNEPPEMVEGIISHSIGHSQIESVEGLVP